jgi:hypothetical protein
MSDILKKTILAFILGALTFTPWDILMAHFQVVEYASANYLGIAWWTPLAFGLTTVLGVSVFAGLDRALGTRLVYPPAYLAFEYLFLAGFFIAILFFRFYPYLLSLSLLVVLLLRLIMFHVEWDFLFCMIAACVGPTVELILTQFQFFTFNDPDFMGMPFWLVLQWGAIGMALRRVAWLLYPLEPPPLPYKIKV